MANVTPAERRRKPNSIFSSGTGSDLGRSTADDRSIAAVPALLELYGPHHA